MFSRSFLGLVLLFALDLSVQGGPLEAVGKAPARDQHGDPLPEHALARLGTIRFRQGVPITSVHFSGDGKSLMTVGEDRLTRVWETASGKELWRFRLPANSDVHWVLTPDLRTLVTSVNGEEIRFWDTTNGKLLHRITVDSQRLGTICLAPDGKTLAVVVADKEEENHAIRLWEVPTGNELRKILPEPIKEGETVHKFQPAFVTFTANSKVLVCMGKWEDSFGLRQWDLATGVELNKEPLKLSDTIRSFRFRDAEPALSPDGKLLTALHYDSEKSGTVITLLDMLSGKKLRELDPPIESLSNIQFSPDNRTLVAMEDRNALHLWDVGGGQHLPVLSIDQNDRIEEVVFSPDSRTIAVGSNGQMISLFDVATGKLLHRLKGYRSGQGGRGGRHWAMGMKQFNPVLCGLGDRRHQESPLAFSPDGKMLAASGTWCSVRFWNVTDGSEIRMEPISHDGIVSTLALSPDRKTILSGANDGTVRLWDARTGRPTFLHPLRPGKDGETVMPFSSSFSPDGKTVVVGTTEDEHALHFLEVATGKPRLQLAAIGVVFSLSYSPDGTRLAVGDQHAVSWLDSSTGKRYHRFSTLESPGPEKEEPDERRAPHVAAISGDGRLLAVADNWHGRIYLWELATGKLRKKFLVSQTYESMFEHWATDRRRHHDYGDHGIRHVTFSPDQRTLAFNQGADIQLWDIATGKELRRLSQAQGDVAGIVFSPSGSLLAAATPHGALRLWDPATGTLRGEVYHDRGGFHSIAFASDGKTLLTGGSDTTVLIWDVDSILKAWHPPQHPTEPKELEELWSKLASGKDNEADGAITRLLAAPRLTVPFLRQQIKPATPVDKERVAKLLADLESDRFQVRQQANEELENMIDLVEPFLQRRLADDPPAEVKQRIEWMLERRAGFVTHPEQMRILRAIELLERIGSPEAQVLLDKLAQGTPTARATREAKAALQRLNRSLVMKPAGE